MDIEDLHLACLADVAGGRCLLDEEDAPVKPLEKSTRWWDVDVLRCRVYLNLKLAV